MHNGPVIHLAPVRQVVELGQLGPLMHLAPVRQLVLLGQLGPLMHLAPVRQLVLLGQLGPLMHLGPVVQVVLLGQVMPEGAELVVIDAATIPFEESTADAVFKRLGLTIIIQNIIAIHLISDQLFIISPSLNCFLTTKYETVILLQQTYFSYAISIINS